MIILNTTFHIHGSISAEGLDWIKRVYAASAAKAGAIGQPLLTRIMVDDQDGTTYALHLTFPTIDRAQKWNDGVAASLRRIMAERWGEKALCFHTYLEILQ